MTGYRKIKLDQIGKEFYKHIKIKIWNISLWSGISRRIIMGKSSILSKLYLAKYNAKIKERQRNQ